MCICFRVEYCINTGPCNPGRLGGTFTRASTSWGQQNQPSAPASHLLSLGDLLSGDTEKNRPPQVAIYEAGERTRSSRRSSISCPTCPTVGKGALSPVSLFPVPPSQLLLPAHLCIEKENGGFPKRTKLPNTFEVILIMDIFVQ